MAENGDRRELERRLEQARRMANQIGDPSPENALSSWSANLKNS
jgi:hypothetical protein